MAHKNIEIEIQVTLEKHVPLVKFLKEQATFVGEKHQVDEYFSPIHRDFLAVRPAREWLRLRSADGTFSINYKDWHVDTGGKSYHCDEFETKIENIDQARKILTVLDFKPLVTVDKTRKIWLYKEYEIAIDAVKGLGNFVEIEYCGKDGNVSPKKVTTDMIHFLKKLGCGTITRNYAGYPFLLLFPNEVRYEIC